MAVSARFDFALTISNSYGVDIWDLRSGAVLRSVDLKVRSPLNKVVMLDGDHLILMRPEKPGIDVLNWRNGQFKMKCSGPELVNHVIVSPNGRLIVAGSPTGKLYIWSAHTGELLKTWKGHYKAVTSLAFTCNGQSLITGGADALVRCWMMANVFEQDIRATPTPRVSWAQHALSVSAIHCSAPGMSGTIYTCGLDHTVRCWDIASSSLVATFVLPGYLTTLAVDPAETFLFVGSGKGEIYKVDLFKGGEHETEQDMANRVTVLRGHASEVTGLSLSFYGDRLVSSDIKGQCVVWNTNTCKVMTALQKNRPTCSSVAILQDPLGILPSGMLGNKPKSQFAAPIKMHGLQKTAVAEFPTQLTLFTQQPREALNRMIRPAQF